MRQEDVSQWVKDAQVAFGAATDLDSLKAARLAHAGDKAPISLASRGLGSLSPDEKASFGKIIGDAKAAIAQALATATEKLEAERDKKVLLEEVVDITLPVNRRHRGGLHPISIIKNEVSDFFIEQGYAVAEGPELESGWLNFDALNIPADHPARTMQDTFFITEHVLRTHTSSVQIREMEKGKLPLRLVMPGRVYRNEAVSARSNCFFHQIEGLYIDKGVSFADLKQTLYYFVQQFFGEGTKVRFRSSYFPFTEPSAEVDISCTLCASKGCNVCKHTGWLEIMGCGMVDPNVLEACGIDSKVYSGFAFGMGLERIAQLKFRVTDLRLYSENDMRFLRQFKSGMA